MNQRLDCLSIAVLLTWCAVAALGCNAGSSTASGVSPAFVMPEKSMTIDVGVVLANRSGYLCLPLEQLGLKTDDTPVSVATSCECIKPRLVQYVSSGGSHKPAILLDYVNEPGGIASSIGSQPMNLNVVITVELGMGKTHDFTVNLMHTVLASAGRASEVGQ